MRRLRLRPGLGSGKRKRSQRYASWQGISGSPFLSVAHAAVRRNPKERLATRRELQVTAQNSPPQLKRILFIEELSTLIGKAATTIRTCATNRKYQHLIPRPFKLPN